MNEKAKTIKKITIYSNSNRRFTKPNLEEISIKNQIPRRQKWKRTILNLSPAGKTQAGVYFWVKTHALMPVARKPAAGIEKLNFKSSSHEGDYSLVELEAIQNYLRLYNLNFYAATSKLNTIFKRRLSVEQVKDLFFKNNPRLNAQANFDLNAERIRKEELEKLIERPARVEERILELSMESKALNDEIRRRKNKKKEENVQPDKSSQGNLETMGSLISNLPSECTQRTTILSPSEDAFLISSLINPPLPQLSAAQTQSLNDYLYSMLNYDQAEPIKVTSLCTVKLWNQLRQKILILQNLQSLCEEKRQRVSAIENSFLAGEKKTLL